MQPLIGRIRKGWGVQYAARRGRPLRLWLVAECIDWILRTISASYLSRFQAADTLRDGHELIFRHFAPSASDTIKVRFPRAPQLMPHPRLHRIAGVEPRAKIRPTNIHYQEVDSVSGKFLERSFSLHRSRLEDNVPGVILTVRATFFRASYERWTHRVLEGPVSGLSYSPDDERGVP